MSSAESREIIQEAVKCMRHSKRAVLTGDDVDSFLRLRNLEPTYGFTSNDAPQAPPEISVIIHWLALEGVQQAIPENPPVEEGKRLEYKDVGISADVSLSIKHVVTKELPL
ncbi:hypothetical protein MLD38_000719 [Melastoma candidum]|uniref:Uncharacterized protein n=1 Tax=Melastoma candidum TaxID=119954 RepID=A0ACB9SEA8_9MYRT|nr:hypothetical protein MLD38_000719 [Melastoma candidum]